MWNFPNLLKEQGKLHTKIHQIDSIQILGSHAVFVDPILLHKYTQIKSYRFTHKSNKQQIYINLIDFQSPEVSDRIMFTRAARITTIKRLFDDFSCDYMRFRSVRLIFYARNAVILLAISHQNAEKNLIRYTMWVTVLLLSEQIWEVLRCDGQRHISGIISQRLKN